jgi:hypothetical protein
MRRLPGSRPDRPGRTRQPIDCSSKLQLSPNAKIAEASAAIARLVKS